MCLAFPICVKLLPVMLLWPVWRFKPRLLGGAAAGLVLGLAVIPAVWYGPAGAVTTYRQWVEALAKPMLGRGTDTSRDGELIRMGGTDNQSVLALVHQLASLIRRVAEVPGDVSPAERGLAFGIGVGALAAVLAAAGVRTRESTRAVVLFSGLLVGVALLFTPVIHNFYFLLLLPVVAALVDRHMGFPAPPGLARASVTALVLFAGTDVVARLTFLGLGLRQIGIPLLTLLGLMAVGAAVMRKELRDGCVDIRGSAGCAHSSP